MKLISIYILLFVAQNSFAALPPTYREGQMTFSANTEYFSTTANYDRFSNKLTLPFGQKYQNITTTIDGKFDLPENFVIGGGINMAYARSTGEDLFISLPATKNRTNSEISDGHAFAQYFLDYGRFRLVPELKGALAFKRINLNDNLNDSVLTNDYADSLQAGSWAIINLGQLRGYGYLGFLYQDDDRANDMTWQAGLLWRSHHFLLAGSFDGYQPVINDKQTLNYPRENRTFFVDGQSFRYYATNPALTELRLTAGLAFENNIQITAGWGTTLLGTETAQGQTLFAGLSFGVDMAGGPGANFEHKKHKHMAPATGSHEDSGTRKGHRKGGDGEKTRDKDEGGDFQPDIEEYDESLFD